MKEKHWHKNIKNYYKKRGEKRMDKKRNKKIDSLENMGFEFKERENEKEVIDDILKILKIHGVFYTELKDILSNVTEIFKMGAKL